MNQSINVYPEMSRLKELPDFLKRAETSIFLIVYHARAYTNTVSYCSSSMNQVQE
jgi:hypothetical protein